MDQPMDMTGWSIQSYGGSTCQPVPEQVFAFPAGTVLAGGASIRVHSGPGATNIPAGELLWMTDNIWNNTNDRADLIDPQGNIASTWAYGTCQ